MSLADQQWCPTSVQVTVLQARGLRIKGKSGTNDAYAVMQVGKEKYQTSVVEKSVAPVWREEAAFDLPSLQQGGGGGTERSTLHVHVLHRALVGPDKLLGQAVINLLQLSEDKTRNKTEWFKLLDKTSKADKDRGEVLVDIQFLRNNMTASMFDLSAAGKSKSRLGKFKDKVRGKKKETDAASTGMASFSQVLTDSEEEGNGDDEVPAGKDEKKKKLKMKSLFSPKSNLQKTMSQSMSVLPAKNSSLSGSQSSGLNVDSSEGKKKFKFMIHKRSGSSDSKESSSGHQKHGAAEQSNLCINGSHVYCEEPQSRASRIGSNFSLTSSGHGSMEDVPESSPPSVHSLRAVRQYSPWTEEEEETTEVENIEEDVGELRREEEERIGMEEERRTKEEEEERVRKQDEELERFTEEKKRQEEEKRAEEERVKGEEEERIRRQEEERTQAERRRREEEERVRREEERERLAEENRRLEEQEMRRIEEEEKRLREEGERLRMEEEARMRQEEEHKLAEEKRRLEEKIRIEEEKVRQEERAQEERRREEMVRRQEKELEEKRILEEQERQRKEEEIIKEKERRQEEEKARRERDEYERLVEEKRKLEEEESKKIEEEEERRRVEEEKRAKEEERVRRQEEEREKLAEQKRILEEQERRRIEDEEKRQRAERISKEEERRRKEEERIRRQEKEEVERLAEEKRRREEEERRTEERVKREEEERIRKEEEERRREEEERVRKENEEMERLAEEKRRLEEQEMKRTEEEERARREEKAERESKEEQARKLEKEKFVGEKRRENETKHKAAEMKSKVAVESPADVTSTNPFDENLISNNPFEEIHSSPAGPDSSTAKVPTVRQRCQSAESSVGSKTVSTDEKDLISSQWEKRPAPQPPGRNQAERQSQKEQDGTTPHLAKINKHSKGKDVKTISVLPQRSVQIIAPVSRSPTETKNTQSLPQSSTTEGTTNVAKHSKRPAPSRPRSVEEGPSSEPKTALSSDGKIFHECGSEAKQQTTVYGLNPFEDDEDDNELTANDDTTTSGKTGSVQGPPAVSQGADKGAASQTKIKSSKVARAPPLPTTKAATSSTLISQNTEESHVLDETGVMVPDNRITDACVPESISPLHVQESPSAGEEASGKKGGPPTGSRRLQPVKPLNPLEQQSVSVVGGEKDNKSTGILCGDQQNTKANDTGPKGPYSQLTQEELISLVLKQKKQLSERDKKISELEQYIDNLLVRVIEEQPSILMSMNSLKKSA